MHEERNDLPESPTAIGMETGMDVPGLADVRGPLEEALVFPPTQNPADPTQAQRLDVVPGQSGAEALAFLPPDKGR